MQFKTFEEGIEVNGQTVYAIVDGFSLFKEIPSKILFAEGIGTKDVNGIVEIAPDAWYSHDAWLRAFEKIAEDGGIALLYKIGARIPENAAFPPWVDNIDAAIRSIDIAYHMNHRKQGSVMFGEKTGTMLEGIGHYGYEKIENQSKIISVCNNPYPCEFDRGIITTMAKKFESGAMVTHDDEEPCRKKGADACTYNVTW